MSSPARRLGASVATSSRGHDEGDDEKGILVVNDRAAPVSWTRELIIDGRRVVGAGPAREVPNPATEAVITTVSDASARQCDAAVAAARSAFECGVWADGEERGRLLMRLADALEARSAELTSAIVQEVGTPISTAESLQIATPIAMLRSYAGLAGRDRTEQLGVFEGAARADSFVAYRPVGVVACVIAYNYPLLLTANKIGAALAAGCTTVVLTSPRAPLTTLLLGEIALEVGFPPGVINVIVGGPDIGRQLTGHPGVDKVSFTGSVDVGRIVMKQAAENLVDVVLELGGKSAAILLPDVDLAKAVAPLHQRYARNAGQGCASPTRLLVDEPRFEEFVELSRKAYAEIKVGDPFDRDTIVGPLIRPDHRDRVEQYIESALADGGTILAGGGRPPVERGWYINPTLIGDLDNSVRACREEIFGPVAVVFSYRDLDDAVAIANDSPLGLQAYLFGSTETALELAPRLRAGTVTINGGAGTFRTDAPLGGFKQSGIGRESGEWGVGEFLEPQHVTWRV
jgi:aldehyde dehydrogenase (NAD+)/betaine-aldehyde dehydrogenase